MLQLFKNILTKADFDYDDPNIDLYKFHPQIRIFLVFNGIFFNNKDSRFRFVWPIMSVLLAFIAAGFEVMFIYHGFEIKDYTFATECFTYFLIITTVPIVYTSVLFNTTKIVGLLNNMNMDFRHICNLGPKYKDRFLRGQLLIWQLCITWFLFILCILSMYIMATLIPLLYQSLFATQHEHMVRPLLFPMWLPEDDPYRTPNYEIFLFLEIVLCLIVIQTFCVYIYLLFHFLLHYFYLMNMIILDFEVMFSGLEESVAELPREDPRRTLVQCTLNKRMGRVVEWHISVFKSVEAVSSIYGPPLVYQVMFSSIAICLMAYQVADSLDQGKFHYLFTVLMLAACLQLWIPCYLGTLIRNKGFSVGEACWGCGWHETALGRLLRQDIIVVVLRAQQPVSINFTGLPRLELETFSSITNLWFIELIRFVAVIMSIAVNAFRSTNQIMSTSYSYFNLLRQY